VSNALLSFQTPPFASLTNANLLSVCSNPDEEPTFVTKITAAFHADEAFSMPLTPKSSDDDVVNDKFLASAASACSTFCMTANTPCVAILLDKGGILIKGL